VKENELAELFIYPIPKRRRSDLDLDIVSELAKMGKFYACGP